MKRRDFLQSAGIVSLPILLGGTPVSAITRSSLSSSIDPDSDRVLVLVQLNGGNDGLNTLIPLDQYDDLAAVRANIIIPEDRLLKLDDIHALHPSMQGMQQMYEQERLGIIQDVGYPDQNRSHFRSTDIWTSASHSDEYVTTGWLGRVFNVEYPDFPVGYPNDEVPDPFAITLGFVVSETCQGPVSNYSYTVTDPEGLGQLDESSGGVDSNSCYGQQLAFIREAIAKSNAYAGVVKEAYDKGTNHVTYTQPDARTSTLHEQLRIVARLISGGLKTKVYVVSLGGFDTHAAQTIAGDPLSGNHATLLQQLSSAVSSFQEDTVLGGYDDRVVGMTFSEFGRRIRSNDSLGTDHGTAAPLLVFGTCVQPGIIGANPEIDRAVDQNAGVPMQYDFRSVYGTMLVDWLGMSEADVRDVIYEDFQHIPFLKACEGPVSADDIQRLQLDISIAPNPAAEQIRISLESDGGVVVLQILDVRGALIDTVVSRTLQRGKHQVPYRLEGLASGQYFMRLQQGSGVGVASFVKI